MKNKKSIKGFYLLSTYIDLLNILWGNMDLIEGEIGFHSLDQYTYI